jgi:ribosome-associated toxin RatA of RatAB toxin-antitoxin module
MVSDDEEAYPSVVPPFELFDSLSMQRRHRRARIEFGMKPIDTKFGERNPFTPTHQKKVIAILSERRVFATTWMIQCRQH